PLAMRYMDFLHLGATCLRDFFFENGYVYFVIDYVPGHRLSEIMSIRHGCPFPEMEAVSIAMQIAVTMQYLHTLPEPVFLADMNLSNVIIAKNGAAMLTDYGLGKLLIRYDPNAVRMGTLGYAAPEQIGPNGVVNAYTDMYALGVLMHQLVTSVDPTKEPNVIKPISKYNVAISQDYMSIVSTATNPDPHRRFVSMKEMLYALQAIAPQRGRSTKVVERNIVKEIMDVFTAPFTSKESK
ncbi:protein kinase, partial [bacterium]|nr:protein kinase [bacterium]